MLNPNATWQDYAGAMLTQAAFGALSPGMAVGGLAGSLIGHHYYGTTGMLWGDLIGSAVGGAIEAGWMVPALKQAAGFACARVSLRGFAKEALKSLVWDAGGGVLGTGVVAAMGYRDTDGLLQGAQVGMQLAGLMRLGIQLLQPCFRRGTPLLALGGAKAIDRLIPGQDRVLARSEFDPAGPLEYKLVEEVFERVGRIANIHANGQTIGTTMEHRFYVAGKGWLECAHLQPGDRFLSHDGQWVTVEEVYDTGEYDTVYNVRVAEYHTYFVGSEDWGFSVWSHNACVGYDYTRDPVRGTHNANETVARELRDSVIHARMSNPNIPTRTNLASIRFRDPVTGEIQTQVWRSQGGFPEHHSEQRFLNWFRQRGGTANDIIGIYSERAPCPQGRIGCAAVLRDFGVPQERIHYSLPFRNMRRDPAAATGTIGNTISELIERRLNQFYILYRD